MKSPRALLVLLGALCCAVAAHTAVAAEPGAAPQTFSCAECGMTAAGTGQFISRLTTGGTTSYFCDIGDLVAFIGRTQPTEYAAAVRDFRSGEWLDAAAAVFVIDKKTYASPMGWGVAAFRDRAAAGTTALDFEALRKALR